MKKVLLVALVGLFTFGFTGCNKEEDLPAPEPTVTATTPPVVTTETGAYIRGSGIYEVNLKVLDASSNVVFFNNVTNTGSVTFSINKDEVHSYTVAYKETNSSPLTSETGTYGYNSSTGYWYTPDSPSNIVKFDFQGINVTLWIQP